MSKKTTIHPQGKKTSYLPDRAHSYVNGFMSFVRTQGVVGLAVGLVLGGAVTVLVKSLIDNVVMPPLGFILGSAEGLKGLQWNLGKTTDGQEATLHYGIFLNDLINFIVIAIVVYLVVHILGFDRLDREKEDKCSYQYCIKNDIIYKKSGYAYAFASKEVQMSTLWICRGRPVRVPNMAGIPRPYGPTDKRANIIEEILFDLEPWTTRRLIETVEDFDDPPMRPIVVPVGDRAVIWAHHIGHKALGPKLSPFVRINNPKPTTNFTVELVGSPDDPVLERAYPGEYVPPLPWQQSACEVRGGVEACLAFWKKHAFLWRPTIIIPGSTSDTPPDWYTTD